MVKDDGVEPARGLPYGNGPVVCIVQSATFLVNECDKTRADADRNASMDEESISELCQDQLDQHQDPYFVPDAAPCGDESSPRMQQDWLQKGVRAFQNGNGCQADDISFGTEPQSGSGIDPFSCLAQVREGRRDLALKPCLTPTLRSA